MVLTQLIRQKSGTLGGAENLPDGPLSLPEAMALAAQEGRRWLGATSPNPAVGAVALDPLGFVVAAHAHSKAGTAHAEAGLIQACRAQGLLDRIETLCVTLEPCNHQGRTPPCTQAIIEAGIRRVVIGTSDPNPVASGGIERLRSAGIEVITGVQEDLCRKLCYGFLHKVRTGRPWVTVKRAFDAQGSMIPPAGAKTFTSPDMLRFAHRLRKRADAIITGSGTILSDNPSFTVRHVPDYKGKQRILVILDRRRRVSDDYLDAARTRGFLPMVCDDLETAFAALSRMAVHDVLVEAGPEVSNAVLESGWWTQDVRIETTPEERIETRTNPQAEMPFAQETADWETMLPQENDRE